MTETELKLSRPLFHSDILTQNQIFLSRDISSSKLLHLKKLDLDISFNSQDIQVHWLKWNILYTRIEKWKQKKDVLYRPQSYINNIDTQNSEHTKQRH